MSLLAFPFRPSISGWFDSKIRIWRAVVSKDEIAVERRRYFLVSTVDAAVNRSVTSDTPQDGGNAEVGRIRWYGLPTIDVLPRDVCEVFAGPDRGRTWEVNSYPVRPRNHHTQVDCIEWHGSLPSPPTESVPPGTGEDSGSSTGGGGSGGSGGSGLGGGTGGGGGGGGGGTGGDTGPDIIPTTIEIVDALDLVF